jgi:hypothetical protein
MRYKNIQENLHTKTRTYSLQLCIRQVLVHIQSDEMILYLYTSGLDVRPGRKQIANARRNSIERLNQHTKTSMYPDYV